MDPKDALAYYSRGVVYVKRREQFEAAGDFAQAKKLGYEHL
jgi:hypothetical protein